MSGPKDGIITISVKILFEQLKIYGEVEWKKVLAANDIFCQAADNRRIEMEKLLAKNQDADNASKAFQLGKDEQDKSKKLRQEAEQLHKEAAAIWKQGWKNNKKEADAQNIELKAIELINQSNKKLNTAKTAFDNVKIIIEQKNENNRQHELKRVATNNILQAVKNEIENYGTDFIKQWSGEPNLIDEAKKNIQLAEQKITNEQFEEAQTLANKTLEVIKKLYATAIENKKRYENREIVADAIIDALQSLRYDEPDVHYIPDTYKKFDVNNQLGDIAIFAKSKGETGDMRLKIELDGSVKIDVEDIPNGNESECRQIITDLQTKIKNVTDLQITNWGRAENTQPTSELKNKTKINENEKTRQR
ncbi:MAG: hypothetical protein LBP59_11730 [Planctomycetaceae bacterium]|jgi:hypothetical protein|nr:hypothetical protein [Planctomycetaceae bacterium]